MVFFSNEEMCEGRLQQRCSQAWAWGPTNATLGLGSENGNCMHHACTDGTQIDISGEIDWKSYLTNRREYILSILLKFTVFGIIRIATHKEDEES